MAVDGPNNLQDAGEPVAPPVWIGGANEPVPAAVRAIGEPLVAGFGLRFAGVEITREGHRQVLWVFIDGPEGVSIDDCARVSPELSAALDVDDPMPGAYELRVSSPGLDRPLMTDADFVAHVGREAFIQLLAPIGGRRRFTGEVLGVEGDAVGIRCSDGPHQVPLSTIQRARLKYEPPAVGRAQPGRGKNKK
ncbi:MAG: ribosome maturation factor RimP [Myxococcales bacterium]|nr:ribosome maturation factor RimP [Myxococcales bacterium]MCB9522085.1 ribosome maturation factor RimP [Myxococcales bacterium]